MAQKAQIVAGVHGHADAVRPVTTRRIDFGQRDLFSLTAMLKRAPQEVPLSSSIPPTPTSSSAAVRGDVAPYPKFPRPDLTNAVPDQLADGVTQQGRRRERLAALVTDPRTSDLPA
jgi:hypothetical protein